MAELSDGQGDGRFQGEQVQTLIRRLYAIVAELERLFPGRRFTPDGHLVGSLGEAIAEQRYGLRLYACSAAGHDGETADGRRVQIKTTQTTRVGLYSEPDHRIVLRVVADGTVEEVFNGPGSIAWTRVSAVAKNGQRAIGLSTLRRLAESVPADQRILTCDCEPVQSSVGRSFGAVRAVGRSAEG